MDTIIKGSGNFVKINEFFAKKLKYSYLEGKKVAGLFFINDSETDEDIKKHQLYITFLLSNYTKAYSKYIKDFNTENLRKTLDDLYKELKKFLEKGDTNIQNTPLEKGQRKHYILHTISDEGIKRIYRATLEKKPEIGNLNIFYFSDDSFLTLLEERLSSIEDYSEKNRLKSLYVKIEILKDILKNAQTIDSEVKDWISLLIKTENFLEQLDPIKSILRRIFGIIEIDFSLYVPNQEEETEEEFYRPVITKISVGDRKLSFLEVLQKAVENSKSFKDVEELRDYLAFQKEKIGIDFEKIIEKLYPETPNENNQFLDKLGRVIEEYLKLSLKGQTVIKPVTYKKDHNPILEIKNETIKTRKSRIVILYENLNSNEVDNFIKSIIDQKYQKKLSKYLLGIKDVFITRKDGKDRIDVPILNLSLEEAKKHIKVFNMDEIFTDYSHLKSIDSINYEEENGIKLVNFLMQFAAFMIALLNYEKRLGENIVAFALVDKRFYSENNKKFEIKDTYNFWDMVRVISSMVGFPMQTINTSDQKEDSIYQKFSNIAVFKNMIFSALKDSKEIDYIFTENRLVNIGPKAEVFLIVEHSSTYLNSNEKTYFYEVFKMDIDFSEKKVISVSRHVDQLSGRKAFFIMPGNDLMIKTFKDFLDYTPKNKECYKFILTTNSKSPIYDIVEQHKQHQNVYILTYRGIKTPLILKELKSYRTLKTFIDTGFLVYSHEFKKGIKNLRLSDKFYQKQKSFFCITPFLPRGVFKDEQRFNNIINIEVSLIFPEDGIDDVELFNLMINTVILWLNYRTETFGYSYSKPKFLPKKLPSISIRREIGKEFKEKYIYIFDGFSLCAEISYLIQKFYVDYI